MVILYLVEEGKGGGQCQEEDGVHQGGEEGIQQGQEAAEDVDASKQ
jgi:hypothetical protein